jgi:hypothetical protein
MNNVSIKKALLATALSISNAMLFVPVAAFAADATVHVVGQPAFDILAAAGGFSAPSRAEMIQRNLDKALIASVNYGSTPAVNVSYTKGMPVINVGGQYVLTVDNASAKAAGTTPALLANQWATSLRNLLSDRSSVEAYVAHLTGGERTQAATVASNQIPIPVQPQVAHMPAGLNFPVVLTTTLSSETAQTGDTVEARIDQPIVLGEFSIPAGTVVAGRVVASEASKRVLARRGEMEIAFNSMRLPSGQVVPIHATVSSMDLQQGNMLSKVNANPIGKTAIQGTVGAGVGAALGTAIGAIAGRHGSRGSSIGRGAWSGAAIGGGVGALHALLLAKGANIVYPSGSRMTLQLQAPAQVAITPVTTGVF